MERRRTFRRFNAKMTKMGILREEMNPLIQEDREGNLNLEHLIDPTLVAIFDNAREPSLDLLNNAKNGMIDNFHSIKWLFHELKDLKAKVS